MSKLFSLSPSRFYELAQIQQRMTQETSSFLEDFSSTLMERIVRLEDEYVNLTELYTRFKQEAERGVRSRIQSEWTAPDDRHQAQEPYRNTFGSSFLYVLHELYYIYRQQYQELQTFFELLRPTPLLLQNSALSIQSCNVQQMSYEMQINTEAVTQFASGILGVREGRKNLLAALEQMIRVLDEYYKTLVQRHMAEGIPIFEDPLLTDVAICIYENVDSHGEIESGSDPDKVSAYSIRKATLLVEAATTGLVGSFLREPDSFLAHIHDTFRALWDDLCTMEETFEKTIEDVCRIVTPYAIYAPLLDSILESGLRILDTLDPRSVTYRDPGNLMSPEERQAHNFWMCTIQHIVEKLSKQKPASEVVQYILQRKFELREWQQGENSFYVCRIGSGNQFRGVAPGALEVIPGARPNIKLNEIIGAGFDDVRAFVEQVESAAKWHDLFVATSPSRTADKSNVLLIGPQGCGKSEVLRGVGADKRSISIFAQGSDFNTCWLGEASKNPKRLFQAGLQLQKKTQKHVHFLIDEIDAILNNDRQNAGYINLTLEFQILMDGVVQYPHLSVWGTTNNPNRIPMPMIRRFSKVAIVGELDQSDRIRLLRHFTSFLPCAEITETSWKLLADKLEGATGDVIRKVVDTVWRETMTDFVTRDPDNAESLVRWLNRNMKFDIGNFEEQERQEFRNLLRSHLQVTANQLDISIEKALDNVAILHEIETAKVSYQNAKLFMASVTEDRGSCST